MNTFFRLLMASVGIFGASSVYAQRIDFDIAGKTSQSLAVGFTEWTFGRVTEAVQKFETAIPGDSIEIRVSCAQGEGLVGNAIQTNWYKNGITLGKIGGRLVGDMVISGTLKSDGNFVNSSEGASGLEFQIKGLKEGTHTLLAYHTNTDGITGEIAPLDVYVDGQRLAADVAQTCRVNSNTESSYTYVTFDVKPGAQTTIVRYVTNPKSGVSYACTSAAVNALVFDEPNPLTTAHDPSPENLDMHVDADNGSLTLSWSPSLLAVKHHVMVGTAEGEEVEVAVLAAKDTIYTLKDLYSMNTYYWRIDEEDAEGRINPSEEWSFRPRQLAFPGAEGYGRFAQGGRGGVVYHVTNLKHDHEPGSLLYGLVDLEGPRTIVFDVSGLIEMDMGSVFCDPYVTIAAQTAPGKGICLKYSNLNIGRDDICRFLRAKRGYGDTGNALGVSGGDHAMVDHTTAAWGTDETVSGRGAKNISFQYSMIAEALGIADHKNYSTGTNHGYAATIDGRIGSWHHNLLVNCYGRNWSMGGGMDGSNKAIGQMDIFNNVVYNWGHRATDGGCHECNFVGNYYKMGPATSMKILYSQDYENVGDPSSTWQAYVSGNIRENTNGTLTPDKYGETYRYTKSNGASDPTYQTFVDKPFFPSYAEIHSAQDAFKIVTSYAGAYMPCPDDQHKRVVKETINGTYTYIGSRSKIKGQIDHENDCGGFESYPEEHRPADFDEDQDGIPTWYENIIGTDPTTPNNNADPDRDGWTQLEDYLDFMSHPYSVLKSGESVEVDLTPYFAGFTKSPVYSVSLPESAEATASVSGSTMRIQAGSVSTVFTLKMTVVDAEGSTFTRRYNVAISGDASGIESLSTTVPAPSSIRYDLYGRRIGHAKSVLSVH